MAELDDVGAAPEDGADQPDHRVGFGVRCYRVEARRFQHAPNLQREPAAEPPGEEAQNQQQEHRQRVTDPDQDVVESADEAMQPL